MSEQKPTVILEFSKGLGFGLLYRQVIGLRSAQQYPFAVRFPPLQKGRLFDK